MTHRSSVESNGPVSDVTCSCGWTSTGWPTRAAASTRMQHHRSEHASGEAMPELKDVSL